MELTEYKEHESDIQIIKSDVADIKSALLGNEYNHPGLIERVQTIEVKQKRTDIKIGVFTGLWTGLSFALTKLFLK